MVLNVYVIERLFGIGGIGRLSLFAILQRDLPLVIGTAMIIVLASVVISLLQDVANTIIDPRVAGDA
ncbi:ABC transporter permease subunit [Haladaptatus sp. GCM10025707]|nr:MULTISPECIES: ABC transporter permease subunit [unclassified Haladaptatus]